MKHTSAFLCLLGVALAGSMAAQTPAPTPAPAQPMMATLHEPAYSDVYCAGFISEKPVETGLYVVTGEEGGLKELYSRGDTIFLSHGAGFIVNPGGQYMMLRPVQDELKQEYFKGQHKLLKELGIMYAEVGRVQVNIVHDQTATGTVLQSCGEIRAGDIAIPFNQKPAPKFEVEGLDRFAPPSGKNEGIIVTGKEFANTHGTGHTVFLNIGANKGVEVGQSYRVYRTYLSSTKSGNAVYQNETPDYVGGERMHYKLNDIQKRALPRDVIGELIILHVEGKSATAMVVKAAAEIFSGDQVELK